MMESMLMGIHLRSFIGDASNRCSRCGQGPVVASDGFLMAHCQNCGTYHAASWAEIASDIGVRRLVDRAWEKLIPLLQRFAGYSPPDKTSARPVSATSGATAS